MASEGSTLCLYNFSGFYGINPATGVQLWSQTHSGNISALAHDSGSCYVAGNSASGSQYIALDAQTGAQRWTQSLTGESEAIIAAGASLFALTVSRSPCCSTTVTALATTNGSQIWQFSPSIPTAVGSLAVG